MQLLKNWREEDSDSRAQAENARSRAPEAASSVTELSPFLLRKIGRKSKAAKPTTWKPPQESGITNSKRIVTFSREGSSLHVELDESQMHYRDWQSDVSSHLTTEKQVCLVGGVERLVDVPVCSDPSSPRALASNFRLSTIRHQSAPATMSNSNSGEGPVAAAPAALSSTCSPQLLMAALGSSSDVAAAAAAAKPASPRSLPALSVRTSSSSSSSGSSLRGSASSSISAFSSISASSSIGSSSSTSSCSSSSTASVPHNVDVQHSCLSTAAVAAAAAAAAAELPSALKAAIVPPLEARTQPPSPRTPPLLVQGSLKNLEPLPLTPRS
jgi:hypothetical protein